MIATHFKTQSVIHYFDGQPTWMRYGLAVLSAAIAAIATQHIPVIGQRAAFLLFFFAIIQSAFWLGRNPGFLAMTLSLISVNALVLLPAWTAAPLDTLILNLGFCLLAIVMIATTGLHRNLTISLLESRRDLNHAQAVGKIGNWRMNVQRNELRWSDENHRIFGIPKKTPMTYQTFLATVHPDDRDYVDRMWQAALRGDPYDIEHRIIVAGEVKWVREKAELEFGKSGNLLGGFGTTQDITDHKRNELALAESRLSYTGIVESAMDAIITINADQRILLFNPAAEKMFGCTAAEAIGDSIMRFIPERFRDVRGEHIHAFEFIGSPRQKMGKLGAVTGLRANGEEFSIEASLSQIETDNEKWFTAILRDVTERTHVEIALHERLRLQDQLTKVAATVPGVICSFRLGPDGAASMPYASPVIESVYGLSSDAVADDFSPVFARIHPGDVEHIQESIAESARTLQPWRDTYRYNHPTKGEIWIEGHSMPIRKIDGSVLWHGYIQDVTEHKLVENTLRDQEHQLRLIMDATPALISHLDTDFRYLRVNKTYENWFCMPRDRILGHEAREIIGEKAWEIVRPYIERARAGEDVHFDQQIPYGTNQPRWVHASYIPDRDTTGTVKSIVVHIVDIDDRKRAEQKIALLNQQLQHRIEEMQVIFNTVPIGLAIADDNTGLHIRGNPANEHILGLPPHSELSKLSESSPAYSVIHNGLPLAVDQLPMQRAIRGETLSNLIMDVVRADGQRVTLLSNASPLFDVDGSPRGAVGAFMDITELNQAAETVRASEFFVRDVLNSLPEHVVVLDEHGVVTAVNEPWERFALENGGSSCEVSVGVNYLEVCRCSSAAGDPDARKTVEGLDALLIGKQEKFVMEYPCPTPERKLWFLMHAKRMSHSFQGIIITHVDITEHKRAEAALRETEARLALVIEEVNAGYWDWDLRSRTLFLSPEWKRQIGYDAAELPNHWEEWESRLHPDDQAFVLTAIESYIAGRQSDYEQQFRLRHKNGSYRWIHSRGSLLRNKSNQPYRMLGINLDITDFVKSKELNERRDKMEESFRLYVAIQTAAAIAHELNQPLAAISSYADVALHMLKTGNQNPQKLSHVLENCSLQAQRAGEVIRQLLALLHKGETDEEPMDINHSVHEAVDFMKADGLFDAFEIELNLAADLPLVNANWLQVQKVLINLLRNGLDSMREIGLKTDTITISTQSTLDNPPMAQVTVCDNGKGVADTAMLRTIFQPFYTTKPTGLGMGLAISRSLIKAHSGNMWAEQNVGNGICIHFTLPFVI